MPKEHPCPNRNPIRVPRGCGDQNFHAQTIIPFVFQEHLITQSIHAQTIIPFVFQEHLLLLRKRQCLAEAVKKTSSVRVLPSRHVEIPVLKRLSACETTAAAQFPEFGFQFCPFLGTTLNPRAAEYATLATDFDMP